MKHRLAFASAALVLLAACAPQTTQNAEPAPVAVSTPTASTPTAAATATASPTATAKPTPSAKPTSTTPVGTVTASPRATAAPKKPTMSPAPRKKATVPGNPASVDCAKVACVAITYDDGPGPNTKNLLATLRQLKAPATFFTLGDSVRAHPSVTKEIAADPLFELGNHSTSHPNLGTASSEKVRKEISGHQQRLIQLTGTKPTVFRPPYGSMSKTVKSVVATDGLSIILWDVDTMDWKTRSTSATIKSAVGDAKAGSIILMHDIHNPTVKAASGVVRGLRERGFTLVTVSTLLGSHKAGEVYTNRG